MPMDLPALRRQRSDLILRKAARSSRFRIRTSGILFAAAAGEVGATFLSDSALLMPGAIGTVTLSALMLVLSVGARTKGERKAAEDWSPVVDPGEAKAIADGLVQVVYLLGTGDQTNLAKATGLHLDLMPRLQAILPRPIGSLEREGYYPSPTERFEKYRECGSTHYRTVSHFIDDEPVEKHRTRFAESVETFRDETRSVLAQVAADVTAAVAEMIPPYRAVLKSSGVDVNAIAPGAPRLDAPFRTGHPEAGHEGPDADPAMARIDELARAFRTLDAATVGDQDRRAVARLLEEQLPTLSALHRAATATSAGPERTESDALLADGLAAIERALRDVLDRHSAEIRRRLAEEARYLEVAYPTEIAG